MRPDVDAPIEQKRQTKLHARRTIRYFGEIVSARLLGFENAVGVFVEAKGTMVGGDELQIVETQPAPERTLTFEISKGGVITNLALSNPGRSYSVSSRNR